MTASSAGRISARGAFFYLEVEKRSKVAKITPGEYVRQVRVEGIQKVHWPTRKETVTTAIMVLIMTIILALFFFGIDSFFSTVVQFLLSFLG